MKYKIYADVLYSYYYEFEAQNQVQAKEMIEENKVEPVSISPVTSPMIVDVEEIKRGKTS